MLVGSVTGIHNRNGGYLRSILGSTLDEVTHHDDVGIVADHQNGIFQGLTLSATCNLWIGKTNNTGAKTVGGSFKRETCTGGRLKEKGCYHAAFQQLTVGVSFELLSHLNHIENFLASEIGNRYKIMFFHLFVNFDGKITHNF